MKSIIFTVTFTGSRDKDFLNDIREYFDKGYVVIEKFEVYEKGWFGSGRNKMVLILQRETDEVV